VSPEESLAYRPEIKGWSEDILPWYRKIAPHVAAARAYSPDRLIVTSSPAYVARIAVVEVGVFRGRSLIFLAEELGKLGAKALVIGVDPGEGLFGPGSPKQGPHLGHAYPGFEGPSHDELMANVQRTERDRALSVRVLILKQTSVDASLEIPNGLLDLVFLDGDHEPEAVRADVEAWWPKIARGGILAGHDYGHYAWPGVKAVVDQLRARERATIERSVWWLEKTEGDPFP
jgi:hypothetical protein